MTFNDSPFLWAAARSALIAERRFDRPYDEQSVSTMFHPNGSFVCSQHRGFNGAAQLAVIELWRAA